MNYFKLFFYKVKISGEKKFNLGITANFGLF